jgi:hypothetical protein
MIMRRGLVNCVHSRPHASVEDVPRLYASAIDDERADREEC